MATEKVYRAELLICCCTMCVSVGALRIKEKLEDEIKKRALDEEIRLIPTGTSWLCTKGPTLIVQPDGVVYQYLKEENIPFLVEEHLLKGRPVRSMMYIPEEKIPIPRLHEIPFYSKQRLISLWNRGMIDPENIEEYIARDGYKALAKVLTHMKPEDVIKEIKESGLRGRGGAGFPTGLKWEFCRKNPNTPKYIICNADEGDPGAFMDRSIIEADPHSIIEGMAIGAYSIGASKGYIYIRTEYPIAIKHMATAIFQAREYGLLGDNIFGTDFNFNIEIREGSGAFVCGEETSLIYSIEGKIPEPRQRPPFPAEIGIWGFPTVINNVETFATVPRIINLGAKWFSSIGTENSKGTKVFSVAGDIVNAGLVEVPMGITLREIIFDVCGGIPEGKKFKAVQIGGPAGGFLPADLLHMPIDYESLQETGTIMGSGGMVVMSEDRCIVDTAKYFVDFLRDESCGKCSTCREGTDAIYEILNGICNGKGKEGDLELLEELSEVIKDASLCGLGQSAPKPVLTSIRYFRGEYEAHIKYKKCPAVVCREIISSPCQYLCPLETDVPAYLTLIAKGEFKKALEVIRKTNPLPIICGRVCMAPCETKCRAGDGGQPIAIKELKRFLTDWELSSGEPSEITPFQKRYDEKIAIIGSGPAGLTAGYYLSEKGYNVTIYEKLPVAGGMLAVGIPEYRLPRKLLEMEIEMIKKAGVEIRTSSPVDNISSLFHEGYKAVLIAVGTHRNRKLGIIGENVEGIIDPITFLRRFNLKESGVSLGEKVGIIGGGSTAIDAARTAIRLGAKEVTIFYRRTQKEMPASKSEFEAAIEEGVKIEFLVAPKRILSESGKLKAVEFIRTQLGYPDESGRRRPVPLEGSEFVVEIDSLLPAVSQDPEIPEGFDVKISKWNTVVTDTETFKTPREGVFACGDAVTGPSDVTSTMASAKIAGEFIHKYLRGEELKREYKLIRPFFIVEPIKTEEELGESSRINMPKIHPEERKNNFKEVELGYTREIAMKEAKRCLRCDWELHRLKQKEAEKGEKEKWKKERDLKIQP